MEPPSPARLFATAAGAALLLLGILGFFYNATFGALDEYTDALAGLQVNGWLNLLYVATGAVGVLVAGVSSRTYSLIVGVLYLVLAIAGWGSEWLNVTVAVLGLAAVAGTKRGSLRSPSVRKGPRDSNPRAKPARQRP